MEKMKMSRYDALAEILKAIAHPTRLLIVEELSKKPRCVSELTEMIGADTSTVSKHLALMKNTGIVDSTKNGNQVYYNLRVICVLNFISCLESVIEVNAKEQMELLSTFNNNA